MAEEEHLAILRQGAWNRWRRENPEIRPDFSEADLRGARLIATDLREVNLWGANLKNADLWGADLSGANLSEANLSEANLSEANLPRAILWGADLSGANLSEANLWGANLSEANLVYANLENATLSGCNVFGISVWELQGRPKEQTSLNIAPRGKAAIMVDDIEVAQFIYMLLNHEKLRNVINAVTQKGVLILGRFGDGGIEVLHAIADKLREHQYLPMIFDFDRPDQQDYTETVKTLVNLARFVIVDVSGPSVPQELSHTVPFLDIPFVPIIEAGRKPYAMVVDLFKYPWFLSPIVEFENKEALIKMLPERVIEPAEAKHAERQKLLDQIFKR